MSENDYKTLYLFVDESGNFDFSSKGTRYFILTSISTFNPFEKRLDFLNLRYNLLKEGVNQKFFHATEDKQLVRDKVFQLINQLKDFEIDSVIARKNKVNWSLYEELDAREESGHIHFKKEKVEERFYKQVSETLLQYIIRRYVKFRKLDIEKVIIVLGAVFAKRKQEYITKYLKHYFKENFQKIPYIYFHHANSDINCQIADYCGWAIFIKWERHEIRAYNQIKDKIKSEFDIFRQGETIYYDYKK